MREKNTVNWHAGIACEGGSCNSSHKHFLRELKFGLEGRLIWGKESVPAKSRLVEFNEFYVSAGETTCTTLITLCNELRSGEHRRKTKALSSPTRKKQAKQKRCIHTFKAHMDKWNECGRQRWRYPYSILQALPGCHPHVKNDEMLQR